MYVCVGVDVCNVLIYCSSRLVGVGKSRSHYIVAYKIQKPYWLFD